MNVSKSWLKKLVEIKSMEEVERLLPLRSIGTKEITDDFIELDMKGYNRADLLSMRGVAHEIAAITDSQVTFTEEEVDQSSLEKKTDQRVDVKVENPELVPLYCLAIIEGLNVEKSNPEWTKRLEDSGYRSVNNLADVTNLVMLEYGQPLHAFDASQVKEETIVVRNAREGEKLITLDGKERELTAEDILIADEVKPLGLAGVMGGKTSEVTDSTHTILLEAAIFDPKSLRKTSTRLGLQSEASKRFYHGLTAQRLFQALDQAINMYQELGGKLTALTIVGEYAQPVKKIELRHAKLNSLIGIDISPEQVKEYLEKLNFKINSLSEDGWEVTPPYWRLDIEIEEDLVEEVARMYGYEKIPAKPLAGGTPEKIDQSLFELVKDLKQELVNLGLTEVQTYSFYSTKVMDALGIGDEPKKSLIKVANPMSVETEYMRQNIWPNLVEVIDKNIRQGFEDIAVFEIGKVYMPDDKSPTEYYRLSIALLNGTDNPISEIYQIFQNLPHAKQISLGDRFEGEVAKRLFHPTRDKKLVVSGKQIGGIAEIHPRILSSYGIEKRIATLEIDLEPLL